MKPAKRQLELLSPARDADTAIAAINAGADAVYIGGPSHGARASAGNSITDIKRVCDYAHMFRARVYVTVNTIIYEDELADVASLVRQLYSVGVDALIVQDMALLEMDIPPIPLHASTQCDIRTPQKASLLAHAGMSQLVLPREFTLDEIAAIHQALPDTPLEVFVHGALCVSYSGDCRASLVCGGRSANRGQCAQICRLPYTLSDADGNIIGRNTHYLSLRDLNRIRRIEDLADAGASSFKIEGRLKDARYVRTVTAAYSQALDDLCRRRPDEYERASAGRVSHGFVPDLNKAFNRGFTTYMLDGTHPAPRSLSCMRTPKHTGVPVAEVTAVSGRCISVKTHQGVTLANGDGLGYFDNSEGFVGFRLNRVEGNRIFTLDDYRLRVGDILYRNYDKTYDDIISSHPDRRTLQLDMTLRTCRGRLALDISDHARGLSVTSTIDYDPCAARTDQHPARLRTLSRLGDTIYTLERLDDRLGDVFVPASLLTDLRRRAIGTLDMAAAATRPLDLRQRHTPGGTLNAQLTFHDNVSNSMARRFYTSLGATAIEPALETAPATHDTPIEVMCSRYCIRREIGACLKTPQGRNVKGPLYLKDSQNKLDRTFRLDFDCRTCTMHVIALPSRR